jgi:hypothetical protein
LGFARGGRYEIEPADMNEIVKKSSAMFGRTKKELAIHKKYEKDLWTVKLIGARSSSPPQPLR